MRRFGIDRPLLFIILAFILSRIAYYGMGVRFDMAPLDFFDQFLDPALLRSNLLESLWYQHSQPPLFNLYIGLVLKGFPGYEAVVFHLIAMLSGLAAAVALHRLMVRMRVSATVSAALVTFFIISPSCLLVENQLFYDHALLVLFCIAPLFLHRFLSDRRTSDGMIFFMLLAMVMLLRSAFHPLWLVVVVIGLCLFNRPEWKRVVAVAALPAALVFALYLKNLIVFGGFFGSSWMGANLQIMTIARVPLPERAQMVARHELSAFSMLNDPFDSLPAFRGLGLQMPPRTGIPALDEEMKSTGAPNNNHLAYIGTCKTYLKDGLYIIRTQPARFLGAVVRAWVEFFYPSSSVWSFQKNRDAIAGIDRFYNIVGYGQVMYETGYGASSEPGSAGSIVRQIFAAGLFLALGYPLLSFYAGRGVVQRFRRGNLKRPDDSVILFMLLTILYIFTIGNALSLGENSRYRFPHDPFILLFLGLFFEAWIRPRWRGYRERLRSSGRRDAMLSSPAPGPHAPVPSSADDPLCGSV